MKKLRSEIHLINAILGSENKQSKMTFLAVLVTVKYMGEFYRNTLSELLGITKLRNELTEEEIKLKVALHLSPPSAIDYESGKKKKRWQLIKEYVTNYLEFDENSETTDNICKQASKILQKWNTKRRPGKTTFESQRDNLLRKCGNKCSNCNVSFSPQRLQKEITKYENGKLDEYKSFYNEKQKDPTYYLHPEIDHINPISSYGDERTENKTILCKLCNQGKTDGSQLSIRKEFDLANKSIQDVNVHDRHRLFYLCTYIHNKKCTICGTSNEITIRKIIETGPLVLTNLKVICYTCLEQSRVS